MSLSNNFPSTRPSLLLNFARAKQLDPRITFTRASTAVYYDGDTVAKAEENLLLQSQDFNNAGVWGPVNATITANATTAPDGTTTAEVLTDNATNASHRVTQILTSTVLLNTTYTLSAFLKAGTSNFGYLSLYDPTTQNRYFTADFNLSTGVVRTSGAGTSGTLTSSSITSVGNGWYRCTITGQIATASRVDALLGVSDGTTAINTFGTISYVGTSSTIQIWGAQLEQRSAVTAYTATTTQPITNYVPVLLTAQNNVPRFDHNPVTEESLGLLIEEQRTNLLTSSETIGTPVRATGFSNISIAPDGTQTADLLVPNTDNLEHYTDKSVSVTSGVTYTFTVYAKTYYGQRLSMRTASQGSAYAFYNLQTGAVTTGAGTDFVSASMTAVGNDWWRCRLTYTASGTGAAVVRCHVVGASDTWTYSGDSWAGIILWGWQWEAGAFPTSYIATVASQVTRSPDAASMTGTNFSSWFNNAEGTLYFESQTAQGANSYPFSLFGINTFNRIFANYTTNARLVAGVRVNSVFEGDVTTATNTAPSNTFGRGALGYKVNDFGFSWNGATALTDSSLTLPTVLVLYIGNNGELVTNWLNGHIARIAYYPFRLSNAQLQALTRP